MKQRATWMMISFWAGLALAGAQDAPQGTEVSRYLEDLQVKMEHSAQRSNQPTAAGSSVIALRGAKQAPLSKQLYWKGKEGQVPVSPEEIKQFRSAIEEARQGKKDVAAASLKSFLEKYPKSPLKSDAEETLRRLTPPESPANQVK